MKEQKVVRRVLIIGWCFCLWPLSAMAEFSHQAWDQLLRQHVVVLNGGRATQVDYQSMAVKRAVLTGYLKALEQVSPQSFDQWDREQQLAFLINAYNAWTVELILSRYPELDSIKDLGSWFSSPWQKQFIPLLGQVRSLDDIEHGLIRGSDRYKEPRIHFAVNCASIGCPALLPEAYTGGKLEQQLQRATQQFLMDDTRNRLKPGRLEVSKIFDWYQQDFEAGWRGLNTMEAFLAHYSQALGLSEPQRRQLLDGKLDIEYLKYDWSLNDVRPQ